MHRTTEQHLVSPDELYRHLDTGDTSTAVSVIVKVRGETCDIDCLYCYEKRKEAPGGARIGPDQVRALGNLFRGRPLAVELHGGEPLTAGREHIAEILRELGRQPQVVRVSLQTNGVQLDTDWLDLFDELCPALQIGISLDGDALGNAWRVGYDGEPVYPKVAAALELLAERGRPVGVIAAVTPQLLGRAADVLDHLAGFGSVNAVSFVPCFDATVTRTTAPTGRRLPESRRLQQAAVAAGRPPAWGVSPQDYAEFALSAARHWVASGLFTRISLEPAVSTIRRLTGRSSGFCHFSDLKCDHVFTLYPDGRLGSCDELPWPQAQLGLLPLLHDQDQVTTAQQHSKLLGRTHAVMSKCTTCRYQQTCGGGCVATRLRLEASDDPDAYCDYRMRLVDGMAALLAQPRHLDGMSCRTLRWNPRNPNVIPDVDAFLTRWNLPEPATAAARLRRSAYGNINTVGEAGIHEAEDLHPGHPDWQAAIEPRAWPAVDALTRRWGLSTYDSCEGHAYPGLALPPAAFRIGVLPRSPEEYAQAAAALCRAAGRTTLPSAVSLTVGRAELESAADGKRHPVLDLLLRPAAGHGWAEYFDQLDQAAQALCHALEAERPTDSPCGCASAADRAEGSTV